MIQLPKVATLKPKSQPHNFFIWGETMSGKSYFSSYFPNPLVLNTDGNSEQGQAPSIQIRNIRDKNGKLNQRLNNLMTSLQPYRLKILRDLLTINSRQLLLMLLMIFA